MTLLDDLRGLDLSAIIDARTSVTAVLAAPQLRALVETGPLAALGETGERLQALRDLGDDPTALFGPLVDALDAIARTVRPDQFPVAAYLAAVADGAQAVAALLSEVDATPESWLRAFRLPVGEAIATIRRNVDGFGRAVLADTGRFTHAAAMVKGGLSGDPASLVEQGLAILLPFGSADLAALRRVLDANLSALAGLALPSDRNAGLLAALADVRGAAAAADGDAAAQAALLAAMTRLGQARATTVSQLRRDLMDIHARLGSLQLPDALQSVATAAAAFRTGEPGFRELMEQLRGLLRSARAEIDALDGADLEELVGQFEAALTEMEAGAKAAIEQKVDVLADELVAYVRSFFGHLHLSELRATIHGRFAALAATVAEANLDHFADEGRRRLAELREMLSPGGLADRLRPPLQQTAALVADAVGAIGRALEDIAAAITALVDQAAGLLEQAANLLRDFKKTLDEVVAAIDGLEIEEVTTSVLDRLAALRRQAQDLLGTTELPEPLRPVVEQLAEELRALDLEVLLLEPVRRKAEKLTVSATLRGQLANVVGEVDRALQNLVPAALIESIEAEIGTAIAAFSGLSSSRLVAALGDLFGDLADAFARLDPMPAMDALRRPFEAVIAAIDAVKPSVLLRPVLEAYDGALGALRIPDPVAAATSGASFLGASADAIGAGLTAPLGPLLGAQPATEAGGGGRAETAGRPPGTRPGDFVRLLGLMPAKLKQAVAGLGAGPLAEAEAVFERLTAGLSRDLRGIEAALWALDDRIGLGIDALLQPLAAAELDAGFAIGGRLQVGPLELEVAAEALANASPGALRAELDEPLARVRSEVRRTIAGLVDVAAGAEAVAAALESATAGAEGGLTKFLDLLDPEPVAAEVDALIVAALGRVTMLSAAARDRVTALVSRLTGFVRDYGPGMLAQRFSPVLDAVREELDALSPHRLAADLDLVHTALRDIVAAYDPGVITAELRTAVLDLSAALRGIDVAAVLGDLSFLDDATAGLAAAVPANALRGVGEELAGMDAKLAELDPRAMLEAVDCLGPRVVEQFDRAVHAVRAEIATLLESLRFTGGGAAVSGSARIGSG